MSASSAAQADAYPNVAACPSISVWESKFSYPGTPPVCVTHDAHTWSNKWWANPGEEPGVNEVWADLGAMPQPVEADVTVKFNSESQSSSVVPLPSYTDTSTYFLVPKSQASLGPTTPVWSGSGQPAMLTVYALGSDNTRQPVYLRAVRNATSDGRSGYLYAMNDGVTVGGYGMGKSALILSFERGDNMHLKAGVRYVTSQASDLVTVNAHAWHYANDPVTGLDPVLKTVRVGVEVTPSDTHAVDLTVTKPGSRVIVPINETSTAFGSYFTPYDPAVGPTVGTWSCGSVATWHVPAFDEAGRPATVKLRAYRDPGTLDGSGRLWAAECGYNEGVHPSSLVVEFNKADNPGLTGAHYYTKEPVMIAARAWHGTQNPGDSGVVKDIRLKLDLQLAEMPDTLAPTAKQVGGYFAAWSIYDRNYYLKDVDTTGQAKNLTFINYGFGNVYKDGDGLYRCKSGIVKAETGKGDGGDAYADYGKTMDAQHSVDGVADIYNMPMKGNFNQLKELKAKYPNIRTLISLGGWTWSKHFADAANTHAKRKELARTCIDTYIKGNLTATGDAGGGQGVAKGVFDGIDVDWEFPGGGGLEGNLVDPNDKQNYTLLLKEFRQQLDELSRTTGTPYLLTVALGAGVDKIDMTEPAEYSKYLNWANLMSYDFHGAWDEKSNHQAAIHADSKGPNASNPTLKQYNASDAVKRLKELGMPMNKLTLGVPFYGRGWNVSAGANYGLYQTRTSIPMGKYESGIEDYKLVKNRGTYHRDANVKAGWGYDGTTMWTYDDATVAQWKVDFAKQEGLAGVFGWELDGDDKGELTKVLGTFRGSAGK
ncbi:glycoside hydrolase family 18 protein [Pararobbsia alpina]|nr:glycoside hydrolase family 18 protein [Pararobbsia alpina]